MSCIKLIKCYVSNSKRLFTNKSNFLQRNDINVRFCAKFTKELENCNVGTIGHVDHGKTTLTSALTKYCSKKGKAKFFDYFNIDNAPAEKARGITINIFHCSYKTDKRHYSHIDCPGHADYVKNMIMGASQMDGGIVVVAATDGEMPQTREHLLLSKQIGINKMVVFVNKADLVDRDTLELVEVEMREVLDKYGFDGENSPVIYGSALLALKEDQSEYGEPSIQKLLDALDSYVPIPNRDYTSPAVLSIDNVLSIVGRGTVVIGSIKQGTFRKRDNVIVVGHGKHLKSTIGDIQVFHQSVEQAIAGDSAGLLLKNVKVNEIRKGMIVCPPKTLQPTNHYEGELYILTPDEGGIDRPLVSRDVYIMFTLTVHVITQVYLPDELELLMPGEHATCKFMFKTPVVMLDGQSFTIKDFDDEKLIGTGRIIKSLAPVILVNNRFINCPRKSKKKARKQ